MPTCQASPSPKQPMYPMVSRYDNMFTYIYHLNIKNAGKNIIPYIDAMDIKYLWI